MNPSSKPIILLSFAIALIVGCKSKSAEHLKGKATAETMAEQEKRNSNIDSYAYDGPIFLKDRRLEALRNLGPLISESKNLRPNPYGEKEEFEFFTLKFKGLVIDGFRPLNDKELALSGVEIASSDWPMKDGLKVGCPLSKVETVLGKPDSTKNGVLLYEGETQSIQFVMQGGLVTKILIGYYTG